MALLAFDEAIALAEELAGEQHPDLAEHATWGASFAESAIAERSRHQEAAAERLLEAKRHVEAWDYPAAIHALETIAASLRGGEASKLLTECAKRKAESDSLLASIAARINRKDVDGLLPLVERAAALRGDRQDLAKLRGQLTRRRDTRLARAQASLAAGDIKTAVAALQKAAPEDYPSLGQKLISDVRRASVLEAEIIRLVQKSKASATVTADAAVKILRVAEEYLKPGPTHTLRGDFKHFEDVVGVPACDPPPHRDTFFVVDLLEEADREAF